MPLNQIPETEAQKHNREFMKQLWISLEASVNETSERIARSFFQNNSFRQVGLAYASARNDAEQTYQIVEDGTQNAWRSMDDLHLFQKIR